jgi:hypothetical protein
MLLMSALAGGTNMQRIPASALIFLASMAPAIAVETRERVESLPDSNPECMEVNGPNCVLRSEVVLPGTATPPGTFAPLSVIVAPAPAPAPPRVEALPGTLAPQGGVIVSAPPPTAPAPEITTVILPPPSSGAQGSATIISPRK